MRVGLVVCCLFVAGCDPLGGGLFVVVNGVSLMAIQRTPPDLAISVLSGRDCSIAHVDHEAPYCTPPEPPPAPPPACIRSLGGNVDCWAVPNPPPGHLVADQRPLTDVQEHDRTESWFGRWLGL